MTRPGELDIDRQLRDANERAARALLGKSEAENRLREAQYEIERLRGIITEIAYVAEKVKGGA